MQYILLIDINIRSINHHVDLGYTSMHHRRPVVSVTKADKKSCDIYLVW